MVDVSPLCLDCFYRYGSVGRPALNCRMTGHHVADVDYSRAIRVIVPAGEENRISFSSASFVYLDGKPPPKITAPRRARPARRGGVNLPKREASKQRRRRRPPPAPNLPRAPKGYVLATVMADRWDVPLHTMYKWAKQGRLAGAKRYRHETVERLVWWLPNRTPKPDDLRRKPNPRSARVVPSAPKPEGFLTTAEAAARHGVSVSLVCHWARRGKFPGAFKQRNPGSRRPNWLIPEDAPTPQTREYRRA